MRLLRWDLKAVGPFTDVALDLSAGKHGLHLIHGPNEAGKTSALRALSSLLFGFTHTTPDDFVHPYPQLRVGAVLRHSDGAVLEIVRRKGTKNDLRGADDTALVPPGSLERFLGGLDRDTFETLFGIDQARLAQAGEEIRTGKGRLGELLFAAGTGLAGLRLAQERLQNQLDDLFKPRGQKQQINQGLAELRTRQDELKKLQLPSDEWHQHDRALREAQRRAAELGEQIARRDRDRNRLDRIRTALPLAARRRALGAALAGLGAVIRLRDDFGPESRAARDALQLALNTIEQSRAALDSLAAEIAAAPPSRIVLDAADEIDHLAEPLGAVVKARHDRVNVEHMLAEHAHQARGLLRELKRAEDLDGAEVLRLRADEPASIRALATQHAALMTRHDEARKAIARLEDQANRLDRRLADLGAPRDTESLRHAVRLARHAGDLDARHNQARAAWERSRKEAERSLARLPGWSRPLDELEALAIPLEVTIDRFETGLHDAEAVVRTLDEKRAAEDEEIGQLEARIQAFDLEQDVPSEGDLRDARACRDADWQRVRSAWLDVQGVVSGPTPAALADALERSQARADTLADRLRREADRVSRKSEWLSQLERHRTLRAAHVRDRDQAAARLATWRDEWTATIGALGVAASTPAELRAWLRRREQVVQLAVNARGNHEALEPLVEGRDGHCRALDRALGALGESSPDDGLLAGRLAHAEDLLEREEKAARNRDKGQGQAEEARAELAREQLGLKAVETELATWRTRWAEMMGRIGLEPDAAPEQAEVFLEKIQQLFQELGKYRGFQSRIRGMDRDADKFTADVGALAHRVAPDLDGLPAEHQARELVARLREARAAQERHAALCRQRDGEENRLREGEERRDNARIRLDDLCREAGCESADELPEAERRSAERGRLEDALRDCEDQLLTLGGGLDADRFTAEVEQADPDALGPAIDELDLERDTLQKERETVNQTIGAERNVLDGMNGTDKAAAAADDVQTTLADLQTHVGRYAALRLASAILQRAIERYREKNQGPIVNRASRLFADLTCGAFVRLQIDDDEGRGQGAVLKGVRPDGRLLGVEAMSNGSQDQLFLALRLASLESWLQAHEPIPFVVDDILLNFDDRRALAALRALAGLSRHTQVLFFTHHQHLVDLAAANLPPDVAFVHELPVGTEVPAAVMSA